MSWRGTPDHDHIRTLFVLFPHKVKDREEIKKLHPGIEAVRFKQRATRWCHIKFKTEELAKQAAKELHKKKVKHGRLIVSETKTKRLMQLMEKAKNLFVTNIPKDATKDDVKSAFKTCKKVCIKPLKKNRTKFEAILIMRSVAEAQELLADKESHRINGKPVTVKFPQKVTDLIQNAKKPPKPVKVIGRKDLEKVETMNTDIRNDFDEDSDTSLNKVEENSEKKDHVMQNYKVHIGKLKNNNSSMQEMQQQEEEEEEDDDDDGDDDVEDSQGQESD